MKYGQDDKIINGAIILMCLIGVALIVIQGVKK